MQRHTRLKYKAYIFITGSSLFDFLEREKKGKERKEKKRRRKEREKEKEKVFEASYMPIYACCFVSKP